MYISGTNQILDTATSSMEAPHQRIVQPGLDLYIPESYWKQAILHVDVNYFYAQCETLYNPCLRGKPVAVVGDEEERSGIVLTATPQAKALGVKTAMVYWEAEQKCPGIIFVRADYGKYRRISTMVRNILLRFSDRVEPFGLDESWVDVTGSLGLFGPPHEIARQIAECIRREIGLTVSIGVSHNKTLSKLGSDYKKPDAITVLDNETWRDIVFPLPVGDMMMIGRRTVPKLTNLGIYRIGELAAMPPNLLEDAFGKMGLYYWMIANGLDQSPVALDGQPRVSKEETIGNSQTAPFDMSTEMEVRCQLIPIAESVAARVRQANYLAWGISIFLRDNELHGCTRQIKLYQPTCLARDILEVSMELYRKHQWGKPLRAVGTRAIYLTDAGMPYQVDFTRDAAKHEELLRLELTKDELRYRFGNKILVWGRELYDPALSGLDKQTQNVVHPVGYMHSA